MGAPVDRGQVKCFLASLVRSGAAVGLVRELTKVRPAVRARCRSLALSASSNKGFRSARVGASASPHLLAIVTRMSTATQMRKSTLDANDDDRGPLLEDDLIVPRWDTERARVVTAITYSYVLTLPAPMRGLSVAFEGPGRGSLNHLVSCPKIFLKVRSHDRALPLAAAAVRRGGCKRRRRQ